MRRTTLALATAALVLALGAPTNALHCNGDVTTLDTPTGTFYIDDRTSVDEYRMVAIYMESNGEAGLQSGYMHVVECIPNDPLHAACKATQDACIHPDADLLLV